MGLAHLSCLVRQAEMAVKQLEEWNTGVGFEKWQKCFDCGQFFHGAVDLALAWASWNTYVGRPEPDAFRTMAMGALGNTLRSHDAEQALPILEASLSVRQRLFQRNTQGILIALSNLAGCFGDLGRHEESLGLLRQTHVRRTEIFGSSDPGTLIDAHMLAKVMLKLGRYAEAKTFLTEQAGVARNALGPDHSDTLEINHYLSIALADDPARTLYDLRKARNIAQDTHKRHRRVLGPDYPGSRDCERFLSHVAQRIANFQDAPQGPDDPLTFSRPDGLAATLGDDGVLRFLTNFSLG
mmetsp:Transcript_27227/g.82078  ORF Transcript_27227/g.82078 Transcript_27227/m.82078 type:complete len:296 (+) Transcript_27227:2-889(+)